MKNLNKKFLYLLTILIFFGIGLFAFTIVGKVQSEPLETPVVTISSENVLSWNDIDNASSYDILVDNKVALNVAKVEGQSIYSANITSFLNGNVECKVRVRANPILKIGTNYTSSYSSMLIIANNVLESSYPYIDEFCSVSNLKVEVNKTNNKLVWDAFEHAGKYVVSLSSNNGVEILETENNFLDLKNKFTFEIVEFRVGYKFEDKLILSQETVMFNYANLADNSEFTSVENCFYFNNNYNDLLIQSENEFFNILYYMFIYRMPYLEVKLTPSFYDENFKNGRYSEYVLSLIQKIPETYAFEPGFPKLSFKALFSEDILQINFGNLKDSSSGTKQTEEKIKQDLYFKPYYKSHSYKFKQKRSNTYNNFHSDRRIVVVSNIKTSEQLYKAITSGAKPVCVSGSKADILYKKIKTELNSFMYEDMTDFDKILSIYDYVAYNTVYAREVVKSLSLPDANPMDYNCFYLEGVFDDGVAVCDGLSKAFAVMCEMEGIDCVKIAGKDDRGNGHAWNKVKLNGYWYGVDITWTDITVEHFVTKNYETLTHGYFLLSDKILDARHVAVDIPQFKNLKSPNNNSYSYYDNLSYSYSNGINTEVGNYVVRTKQDLKRLYSFAKNNDVSNIEFLLQVDNVLTKQDVNNLITTCLIGGESIVLPTENFELEEKPTFIVLLKLK